MSYFTDPENDFTVYEAPKNGGTTLRLWIYYAGTGEIEKSSDTEYYAGTSKTYHQLQEWGYTNGAFEPTDSSVKVCIKRNPFDRFVSCFADKVIKEGRLSITIDDFLDNFDEVLDSTTDTMNDGKTNYMKFHFASQTYHFGSDKSYYDHVFDVKEVSTKLKDFLSHKWCIEMPFFHARKSAKSDYKFDLTTSQKKKLEQIYQEDFQNGWY